MTDADRVQRFTLLKAMAANSLIFTRCEHRKCRRKRRCCGGPRGFCRKSDGVPHCRIGAPASWWQEMEPLLHGWQPPRWMQGGAG